jgi:hypothetical protein
MGNDTWLAIAAVLASFGTFTAVVNWAFWYTRESRPHF